MLSNCAIRRLDIREGTMSKSFLFSDDFNLIYSYGKNSVGKTTLVRAIFYALGEPMASTVKFKFNKHVFRIVVQQEKRTIVGIRDGDSYTIDFGDGRCDCFALPYELNDVRKAIWGFESIQLAENYLAAAFIDQDKGWTLLNRGKVTGAIGFNIELFIDGLTGDRALSLTHAIKGLDERIKRYKTIAKIAGLKEELGDGQSGGQAAPNVADSSESLACMRVERTALKRRANSVKSTLKENARFADYVDSMGLRVVAASGEEILVTKENLAGYDDDVEYQKAELAAIQAQVKAKDDEISALEDRLNGDTVLFSVAEDIEGAERQISKLNIRKDAFDRSVSSLTNQRDDKRQQRREALGTANAAAAFLEETIKNNCNQLGVTSDYSSDAKGIFTNRLKDKSGTNRQLLVLAFRLGYAKALERFCGIRIPFIVDSPRSGEIDAANFAQMMSVLQSELQGWQIVVASIGEVGVEPDNRIAIKQSLMEESGVVTDLAEWEQGLGE